MNRKSLFVTSAIVAATLFGGAAYADVMPAADPVAAAQPPADSDLEGVTVSVTKRNESVQDVPVAVTAYSAEQRDLLGVVSIFDFTRATPSFEYTTALDRAFIRGIGRNTNAPGTQAGVALYVDGVYTSSTYGLDRAPILSGTFEADAGPQGTLFGRNSIGGVLQQNTAHATDDLTTRVSVRYNDHNRLDIAASMGGKVNDHLKLLVGVNLRKQTGGYFNNLALPGQPTAGPTTERLYTAVADYKFGNFDGFVKADISGFNRKLSQYSQYGSGYLNLPLRNGDYTVSTSGLAVNQFFNCTDTNYTGAVPPVTAADKAAFANRQALTTCGAGSAQTTTYYNPINPTALNNFNINVDYQTSAKSHNNVSLANQTTWHLPWFDLKYIGGYNQYTYDNHQDGDGTARGAFNFDPDGTGAAPAVTLFPQVINYFEQRNWSSHEFDFSSNQKGDLSWIVGLYYYHDDFLNRYTQGSPNQVQLGNIFDTLGNSTNPGRNYVFLNYDAVTESKAIFGQVDYQFTPKLKLTAGLRWNRDDVTTTENDHYYSFVPTGPAYTFFGNQYKASDATASIKATCTPTGVAPIAASGAKCVATYDLANGINQRVISDDWSGYGGVLNLTYKPSDDTLMYAKYSRGYKAGGLVSSSMAVQPVLKSESLNAYEIGYKFNPSRKITLNTAAYFYDYRDYQDFGSVQNLAAPSGFSTVGFNIPKSRTYGVELTGIYHPTANFTINFTANYMDAKVKDGTGVILADNLDPLAQGTTTILDPTTGAVVKTYTYSATPCGAPTTTPNTVPPVNPGDPALGAPIVTRQTQCITGDTLKGASPWKVWITPDYRFDFAKGSLDVLATYSWRAGNVSAYSNNPVYEAPAYSSVDARLVWRGEGKRYQVTAFVNNIGNKQGTEFVLPAVSTTTGQAYIQNVLTIPRTWGLELQAKF
jgi:iron complex outermembrane receptor protein